MKVRRHQPEAGWTPVANTAARDYRLSWRARGLLLELLSYPDGWDVTVDKLVAQARQTGDATEGRAAMRNAVGELASLGYVRYTREADGHGHWTTVMYVSDIPQPEPVSDASNRRTRNRTVGEPGRRATGTSGSRSITTKTGTKTVTKTGTNNSPEDHSSLSGDTPRPPAASNTRERADEPLSQLSLAHQVLAAAGADPAEVGALIPVIERVSSVRTPAAWWRAVAAAGDGPAVLAAGRKALADPSGAARRPSGPGRFQPFRDEISDADYAAYAAGHHREREPAA